MSTEEINTMPTDFDHEANELAVDALQSAIMREARKERASKMIITPEIVETFINYPCAFGRHKGKLWKEIIRKDLGYARWLLINVIDTDTSLFKVLSRIVLAPDDIALAKMTPRSPAVRDAV